jgi:hypothetical protein
LKKCGDKFPREQIFDFKKMTLIFWGRAQGGCPENWEIAMTIAHYRFVFIQYTVMAYTKNAIQARATYTKKLRFYLENSRLNAIATRFIMASVTAYFDGYDAPDLDDIVPDASDLLRVAALHQEEIGWDQWLKGRIAKAWGAIYERDLARTDHNLYRQTPDRWAKQIIAALGFEFVLQCWSIRNEAEHGTREDSVVRKKEKLITKIMWLKEKIQVFPNRYLATMTKEDLQTVPLDNLVMTESQIDILIRASKWKACVPMDTEIE